ncbi:MAG: PTS fructose transporter subunit IIC [Peptoniphilaceae bacterium]|nr:PTS fructose transporter subunit IIC [Peptoniphilaceae bacterium]MDD7383843.1 PTS fructose transporter subunit IIC [Peptoniphilaceae bacterium]MDY3737580.1 PTS fructose transporter subunit IIC [Peptoniphilaceae bacterium]
MPLTKRTVGVKTDTKRNNINSNLNQTNSYFSQFQKHLMTGISHMIPVLIMGGLLGAISQVIPYVLLKIDPSVGIIDALNTLKLSDFNIAILKFAYILQTFGFTLFGFAIPMFAAFCANSIGGKTALICGFIGGYIANNPIEKILNNKGIWETTQVTPSGFFGGLIIAFAIGYFVKLLNDKINMPKNWLAFKTTFLIPLISVIVTLILMVYVITPFGGFLNNLIRSLLELAGKSGQIIYSIVLSAATAFDLGGPVNKAAGFIATGFTVDKIMPVTSRVIAIVTPSIGLGLSSILDKYIVKRRVYDKQFEEAGKTAIFLALMGISEGAIPFALERPQFTVPLYVFGSVIGSLFSVAFGAVQWFPESAIWAWPLVSNLLIYVLGILIGSLIIAIVNIYHRNNLIKKGKLNVL